MIHNDNDGQGRGDNCRLLRFAGANQRPDKGGFQNFGNFENFDNFGNLGNFENKSKIQ